MKHLITAALVLLAPSLLTAQAATEPAATAKDASASKAKPKAKAKAKAKVKAEEQNASRAQLHSAASQVAAGVRAAESAMTPAELAIAERVHVGHLPCELGASVHLEKDGKSPGYFNLQGKGFQYRMHPVTTSTGAIRLEDRQAGAVWLQLANKSMLMDQKQGKRLADECASPEQVATAEALKKNPAPSLIDVSTLRK